MPTAEIVDSSSDFDGWCQSADLKEGSESRTRQKPLTSRTHAQANARKPADLMASAGISVNRLT
jgi:hypothetical protein